MSPSLPRPTETKAGKSTRHARSWWARGPSGRLWSSARGDLVEGEALDFLEGLRDEVADVVFLDPPFNIGKRYGTRARKDDRLPEAAYRGFIETTLDHAVRILKPGGALYVYHLPKRAIQIATYLDDRLTLQHWIAISMKNGFVRGRRLYPAHYALLFMTKGEPKHLNRPKLPIGRCPHCGEVIKDYGGYADHVAGGVNLSDVWDDISPVRHRGTKSRAANELPMPIPSRAIDISGHTNGVIVDPFCGTGTALLAAKAKGMRFIGNDRDPGSVESARERLARLGETFDA